MEKYVVGSYVGEDCPMEVDSHSPETVTTHRRMIPSTALLPVVKHNELSEWTASPASSRSPSLPTLTGGVFKRYEERSGVDKEIQSYDHQVSRSVSLNRSISYEQCYLAENSSDQKDPLVKLCKVEQKLEYYSPKMWKRTLVVETLTYNQDPDVSTSNIQRTKSLSKNVNKGERKVTGSKLRNVVCTEKVRPCFKNDVFNYTFSKFLFFLVIPAFLLFFSVLLLRGSFLGSTRCVGNLDFQIIENTLHREVFGQNLALTSFVDALKEIFLLSDGENNSTMSVVMLIGGTGVGKSYMASLFNELYPSNWVQIYLNAQVDLLQEDFKAKSLGNIVNKLTDCGTNLVIIDDAADFIRSHSTENRENFMEQLYLTAQNSGKKILLVLMLNDKRGENFWNSKIQLSQHVGATVNFLKDLGDIQTYTIQFTPLNKEHIVKCIQQSLQKEGISVLTEEISALLETDSVESFPNGCKGIYKYVHEFSIKNLSQNIYGNF